MPAAVVIAACAVFAALAHADVPASSADDTRLQTLMARMRESPGVFARFSEQKEVALLSEPLLSRGVLFFEPPDTLLRMTTSPADVRLLLRGDRMWFRDAAGEDRFDLGANAAARQFVENFLVLFSGDLKQLRARYAVEFDIKDGDGGGVGEWQLYLRPRRSPFDRLVSGVVLEGRGDILRGIEIREADGDRTVTKLTDMDPSVRFEHGELGERFEKGSSSPPG